MRTLAAVAAATGILLLAGCSAPSSPGEDPGGGLSPDGPPVATFDVVGQTYRIELITPELIDHAQRLLDGEELAGIPVGRIVRGGDGGVNAPWSWHIDPASLEFADFTTEVCDGLPEYVEDRTLTSDLYCPWSAKVVAIDYPEG